MASTRNKNTQENYKLQQRSYNCSYKWIDYQYSTYGQAYKPAIPCLGITPSHMPRDTLSHNPVDIESYLRGTGSTNLVNPQTPVNPEFKTVDTVSFFERIPLFVPQPLVILNNQRPFPVTN
jgi:hypothetical protein